MVAAKHPVSLQPSSHRRPRRVTSGKPMCSRSTDCINKHLNYAQYNRVMWQLHIHNINKTNGLAGYLNADVKMVAVKQCNEKLQNMRQSLQSCPAMLLCNMSWDAPSLHISSIILLPKTQNTPWIKGASCKQWTHWRVASEWHCNRQNDLHDLLLACHHWLVPRFSYPLAYPTIECHGAKVFIPQLCSCYLTTIYSTWLTKFARGCLVRSTSRFASM